jgi:hypothetical protein
MAIRAALLTVALLGVATFASAQTAAKGPAVDPLGQPKPGEPVRIVLDVRFLTLPDNFWERIGDPVDVRSLELPPGQSAVIARERGWRLCELARDDRRLNVLQAPPIAMVNGEKREGWIDPDGKDLSQTYRATCVTNPADQARSVRVELTWEKAEPRPDILPVASATIPEGSSWLIHTWSGTVEGANEIPPSYFAQAVCWLFNKKPKGTVMIGRKQLASYMLISPQIVADSQVPTHSK